VVYRFADTAIASDVALPELPRWEGVAPNMVFRLSRQWDYATPAATWIHEWGQPDGDVTLACGRVPSGYCLRFSGQTDFVIEAEGSTIECRTAATTPLTTIRHYLLNQVLPRVLGHSGRLALHASAVGTPAGAIVFLGASGSGKSTVAAGFGRLGHRVLADDCVLVDATANRFIGLPTYTGVRLWPDVITGLYGESVLTAPDGCHAAKHRVDHWRDGMNGAAPGVPLHGLYVLDRVEPSVALPDDGHISIVPMSRREAHVAVTRNAFRLDPSDRQRLRADFDFAARFVTGVNAFALRYPRDLSLLPVVCDAVLDHLAVRA
jgi:hypothetical protein